MDSVECETGELDRADEKVVTQDNALVQKFTAGTTGCVEGTGLSDSESDITKPPNLILKTPKINPIPSL